MALGRINGPMLTSNLERQGQPIALDGALTYWDVNNRFVGINTTVPNYPLDVNGYAHLSNLYIKGNTISAEPGYKVSLGNISSVSIFGGSANNIIVTDGFGNLSFANLSQSISGNAITIGTPGRGLLANAYAANLTTISTVTDSIALVNQALANTAAIIDAVYIEVSSAKNYSNSNVSSYLTVYGGSIVADVVSANLFVGNINGNLIGNVYGNIITSAQPYITSLGNLTSINSSGNITTISNVNASNFNGTLHGNVVGNLSGNVTGTILSSSQPYITHIGTLDNLVVDGQLTVGVLFATSYSGAFNGNVTGNISGNGVFTNISGTLTTSSQPNITEVGTLDYLDVSGNISAPNIIATNNFYGDLFTDVIHTKSGEAVTIAGNAALGLPGGTTSTRPSGVVGYIRYNTDLATVEFFNGYDWTPVNGVVENQIISPDGVNQSFALTQPATAAGILVSINGTIQNPGIAYTVSGMTLIFAEVPRPTDIVDVRYIASTGVTTLDYEVVTAPTVPVGTVTTIIDTFNVAAYRSAKYTISSSNGVDSFMAELLVLQGGGTVSLTSFGVLTTGTNTVEFDANISGPLVNVLATGSIAANQLRIHKIYFDI